MTGSVCVFDIDGTIADSRWRQSLADLKRWDEFHRLSDQDPSIPLIKEIILMKRKSEVVFATSRPEKWRDLTEKWLRDQGLEYRDLLMRPEGDFRASPLVKEDMYLKMTAVGWEIKEVYEDRLDILRTVYYPRGIPCYHVKLFSHYCHDLVLLGDKDA